MAIYIQIEIRRYMKCNKNDNRKSVANAFGKSVSVWSDRWNWICKSVSYVWFVSQICCYFLFLFRFAVWLRDFVSCLFIIETILKANIHKHTVIWISVNHQLQSSTTNTWSICILFDSLQHLSTLKILVLISPKISASDLTVANKINGLSIDGSEWIKCGDRMNDKTAYSFPI